jgi:hypothetical protein
MQPVADGPPDSDTIRRLLQLSTARSITWRTDRTHCCHSVQMPEVSHPQHVLAWRSGGCHAVDKQCSRRYAAADQPRPRVQRQVPARKFRLSPRDAQLHTRSQHVRQHGLVACRRRRVLAARNVSNSTQMPRPQLRPQHVPRSYGLIRMSARSTQMAVSTGSAVACRQPCCTDVQLRQLLAACRCVNRSAVA